MDFNINNYLTNLSYVNKDFNSIWEEILDVVPKLTDKWVPSEANESDPLVVLLKELGIVSDKLNYNIDKNTLEQFPDLLTQLRTAYSVFKSMGYNPNWYKSAVTYITIIYNGGVGDGTLSASISPEGSVKFSLPRFTQVSDDNNTDIYTLLESADFTPGEAKRVSLIAIEGTINDFEVNGDTQIKINNLDAQNRLYFVQPNVAQNGIFISFDSKFEDISLKLTNSEQLETANSDTEQQGNLKTWRKVDNLYQQLPGSYVYKFGIDPSTGTNYIQFPDDIGTLIDKGIYIKYILSSGESGNIKAGTITQLYNDPNIEATYAPNITDSGSEETETSTTGTVTKANFSVRNLSSTQNGTDPETIEQMQKNYERIVGTFDTLVTLRDYNNYIYNATDDVGGNLVSNIKVSDRGDDLYSHLTYKSFESTGIFSTKNVVINTTKEITGNFVSSASGEIGKGTNTTIEYEVPEMSAYDLRLYPLKNTNTGNINSWEDFQQTFDAGITTDDKDQETSASTSDPWVSLITDSISEAKTINHNFVETCGAPIFIDYDISGQIYLQKIVSASEALEVKQAVDLAIYRNFNSRELNFGEAINYPKLVETIKNADPRIQYAAIDAIEYKAPNFGNSVFSTLSPNYDVTTRSILNGSTPWAVLNPETENAQSGFSPFTFHYDQGDTKFYGADKAKGIIKSISPQVSKPHETNDKGIEVYKNETYSILVPSYITQTTYTNYFYAQTNFPLEAGKPIRLDANQQIGIYETKNATTAEITLSRNTLPENAAVLFTSNDSTISSLAQDERTSMGTKLSISVLVPDETILQNSRFLSDKNIKASEYQVKIASNSSGLADYLCNKKKNDDGGLVDLTSNEIKAGYTLNIGEYLLFADYHNTSDNNSSNAPVLEVGIIGEGNTIINTTDEAILVNDPANSQTSIPFNARSNFLIPTTDITSGNFNNATFVPTNSGWLKYLANTIYNFGEGYKLKGIDIENSKYNPTEVFPITLNETEIKYYQSTGIDAKGKYIYSATESGTIPKPINNQDYKMSCQLSLLLTPNNEQTLEIDQQVILETEKTAEGGVTTVETKPIKDSTLQANSTIIYNGGQPLKLTKSESNSLRLMSYTGKADEGGGAWFTPNGKDESTGPKFDKLPTGGNEIGAFLFAYLNNGVVGYIIAAPGTPWYNKDSANIEETIIGKKIEADKDHFGGSLSTKLLGILKYSEYYNTAIDKKKIVKDWVKIVSLKDKPKSVPSTEKYDEEDYALIYNNVKAKLLTMNELYYKGYSPIYTQTDNVIINPQNAQSYFLSNHPCNKYVLPRLIGKDSDGDDTKPLQELEISRLSIRS